LPPRQLQKVERVRTHEAIFLDHYSWLLDRALRLTNGSKEAAEDLVQDLYVRFVQSQANLDLGDEDRLRGYLFTALNNLANSNYHQSRRDPLTDLHTVDYDSMEFALAAIDRSHLLHVRSDLASICEYACIRRKTSRAGSVLILRYFLEYYPPEIVALLKTSRAAVHKLVETARLEARAFLERPGALHFLSSEPTAIIPFSKQYLPDDPAVLFSELRRRILAEPLGACLEPTELDERYANGSDTPLGFVNLTWPLLMV
jgi:RNA polymerase sigma factor (sigma-70 family)